MLEGTDPTLQHGAALTQQIRQQFSTPLALCRVTAAAESADKRRISIQVIDRLKRDATGRWVVLVWLAATSGADPDDTGNTVAIVTGTGTLQEITANAAYLLITDSTGLAQIDLTISGAASRFVNTIVQGKVRESAEITWAA